MPGFCRSFRPARGGVEESPETNTGMTPTTSVFVCVFLKFVYAEQPKGGNYMKLGALVLAFLLFAGMAFAAGIDGKWTGEVSMGEQKFPVEYNFKAEGAKLTGFTPMMDQKTEIKDGKIDGNNISFSVSFGEGEMGMKIDYKGVIAGDTLTLKFEMMGQASEIVLKRAK
jgi:hypothetical protein